MSLIDDDAWLNTAEDEPPDDDDTLAAAVSLGENLGVSRKKSLLRLLAAREAERRGITVGPQQLQETTEALRRRFGMPTDDDLEQFLAGVGVDRKTFDSFVYDVALVDQVEIHFEDEIRRGLPIQRTLGDLAATRGKKGWVQLNVGLARGPAGAVASAVRVFERLWPMVTSAGRPAALETFFMTRKPPDLRIRLFGRDVENLSAPFVEAIADLETAGSVARWFVGPYEPEVYRFGNERLVELAHSWFEVDSLAWLRWEPLEATRGNALGREVLSLAVLNDLFFAVVRDVSEVWDVWCRIAAEHGLTPDDAAGSAPAVSIADVKEHAGPAEVEILERYQDANATFSASLDEAAHRGELAVGPRQLLTMLTLFHWNRFGLSLAARRRIVSPMLRTLDPNR
jgi:thiopeptide-type bacteriocin biosynthesis protein